MGLERSQGRDVMAGLWGHCDGRGPEVQETPLTGPFSPLPTQRHPHSQAHALMLLTVLQGQVSSKLSVTHWGITREKGSGEGGLNGRRQVLRKMCFVIPETRGCEFQWGREKNPKCRPSRPREGECQIIILTLTAARHCS